MTAAVPTTRKPSGLDYRPALDGVRAVAVYLVVAFHAGLPAFSGGFVGVDAFFVLSGYLVTRVMMADLAAGTFSLGSFYSRRVRRLLPAALLVIAVVGGCWVLVASPFDRERIVPDVRAAAMYVANWRFAFVSTDYFAAHDNPSPLLHFWSLSVEEQFYAVWPLALLFVWRSGDVARFTRRLGWVAAASIVASLVALAWTLRAGLPEWAYYGTHGRVYQLMAGVLLAAHVSSRGTSEQHVRRATVVPPAAVVALVVLATPLAGVSAAVRGIAATAVVVALLWALESVDRGRVAEFLASPVPVYLGRISYGVYLWHFPVILVVRRFVTDEPLLVLAVATVVATVAADVSYQVLELPVRRKHEPAGRGWLVATAGVLASAAVGVVAIPALLRVDVRPVVREVADPRIGAAGRAAPAVPDVVPHLPLAGFDIKRASRLPENSPALLRSVEQAECHDVPIAKCVLVSGTGRRLLLVGDSHAAMLLPALRLVAQAENASLAYAARHACPWPRNLVYVASNREICEQMKRDWYGRLLREYQPDVVILASRATDHAEGSSYAVERADGTGRGLSQSRLLAGAMTATARELATGGRLVFVVEPVPVSPVHAVSCLTGAGYADECAFVTEGVSPAETAIRELARAVPGVHALDLDRLACPRLPVCDPIVGGVVVRADRDHLTAAMSARIAKPLGELLRRGGAFDP